MSVFFVKKIMLKWDITEINVFLRQQKFFTRNSPGSCQAVLVETKKGIFW